MSEPEEAVSRNIRMFAGIFGGNLAGGAKRDEKSALAYKDLSLNGSTDIARTTYRAKRQDHQLPSP